MHRIILALSVIAAATPCLAADTSSISGVFGNTIVSTYPDGRTAELWLQPNMTYTAEGRKHDHSNGHWQIKGENLCLKQSHPFAFGYVYCTPIAHVSIGSTWTGKAVTGEAIRIKVVHGRYDPAAGDEAQAASDKSSN